MPIYEYICRKCDAKFEKLVKSMSDADSDKNACPKCGSKKTARTMSVFAVGAEQARGSSSPSPEMCARCGGAGPCPMG